MSSRKNLSEKELTDKLCKTSYSIDEKKSIFLSDNGRKCQICHKIKINKKLSPYKFSKDHQNYICFCGIRDRSQQLNFHHINAFNDNNSNNNVNINKDNNNDANMDSEEDNSNDNRQHVNNSAQNRNDRNNSLGQGHNIINSRGLQNRHGNDDNNENNEDDRDGEDQHGNDDNNGDNGDGGNLDGNNQDNDENGFVTRREFNTAINRIEARMEEMNNNIKILLNQNNNN